MSQPEPPQSAVTRRVVRRVRDILQAAHDRERRGQSLELDIDARFCLHDRHAVRFQLASAILEEVDGLGQEEIVSELLALGLEAVLRGAAHSTRERLDMATLLAMLAEERLDLGAEDESRAGRLRTAARLVH